MYLAQRVHFTISHVTSQTIHTVYCNACFDIKMQTCYIRYIHIHINGQNKIIQNAFDNFLIFEKYSI